MAEFQQNEKKWHNRKRKNSINLNMAQEEKHLKNKEQQKQESPSRPLPPKVFSGVQGVVLIIVLIIAVIGWVLYFNRLATSTPGTIPDGQVEQSNTE